MFKKHPLVIIFSAAFILFISGIGTSYYWLTNIYLPEKINANENAKKIIEWTLNDAYIPPKDKCISETQLNNFILVNQNLYKLLKKIKQDYPESQWKMAVEMIKLNPEWKAQKYLSLKKYDMSPKEYDFIAEEVTRYWIYRFKMKSSNHLKKMGWEIHQDSTKYALHIKNFELFRKKRSQLNNVFTLFLPQNIKNMFIENDSLSTEPDTLF